MNLKNISDQTLMQKTEYSVREERELLTQLLRLFEEIERRRLFCEYKYSSLHKMLVGHFGYSDDEAYRRTSAMRLLREIPEVEEQINKGELSLSHLGLAQSFFKQEQKTICALLPKASKIELLKKISEQPIREAQRIILSQSSAPEALRPERISVIGDNRIEIRFSAPKELEAKIQILKGRLAHKNPNLSMAELFDLLCDMGLEKFKPSPESPKNNKTPAVPRKPRATESLSQVRRQIWQTGEYRCCNCKSTYALELDHKFPRAKGGSNTKDNLRILCRACNQRAAIKAYGMAKMNPYLNEGAH